MLVNVATIMRVLTNRRRRFQCPTLIKANQTQLDDKSLKQIRIINHATPANKGTYETGQLPHDYIFGFCRTFRKVTKGLGFLI